MSIPKYDDRWRVSEAEAGKIYRRVLRFVDSFLAKEKQNVLLTNGRSLNTRRELRQHINGALRIKVVKP